MFSGIVELTGKIIDISEEGTNKTYRVECGITNELYIDQSIAHNGVCLTVVKIDGQIYDVTAVKETLDKTNLNYLEKGDLINLERCLKSDGRLDGHIVQGHVDDIGECTKVEELDGSWFYEFKFDPKHKTLIVDKGSVCINGVSLTLIDPTESTFKVTIIPYTHEHTNFKNLKARDKVNLEFDILGKYINRYLQFSKR
jgi:riboflavin synthase